MPKPMSDERYVKKLAEGPKYFISGSVREQIWRAVD